MIGDARAASEVLLSDLDRFWAVDKCSCRNERNVLFCRQIYGADCPVHISRIEDDRVDAPGNGVFNSRYLLGARGEALSGSDRKIHACLFRGFLRPIYPGLIEIARERHLHERDLESAFRFRGMDFAKIVDTKADVTFLLGGVER